MKGGRCAAQRMGAGVAPRRKAMMQSGRGCAVCMCSQRRKPASRDARAHTDDSGGGEGGVQRQECLSLRHAMPYNAMMDGGMALITMTDRERACV